MGTAYKITEDLWLNEMSCEVSLSIGDGDNNLAVSKHLNAQQLQAAIIRQIEVLSYISEEPDLVMRRFNVKYGEQE